jgi:exonuclease VII large subunit
LDPFEELSSKILFSRRDLNEFLRRWEGLQLRLQETRLHLTRDGEAAREWLDEMLRIHKSIRLESRIHEWQEAYSRLRQSLPSKYRLAHAKFDALSNRALYSREPLQRFWNNTVEQLKGMRVGNIDPAKLTTNLIKDLFLTTSFAFTVRAGSRAE